MDTQSKFAAWLEEFAKRFSLTTPAFFQTLQTIGLMCLLIGFIPDALDWLDVTPPDTINKYITLAVKVAGGVTWIISKLPVQNANEVVRNTESLPFTAKKRR